MKKRWWMLSAVAVIIAVGAGAFSLMNQGNPSGIPVNTVKVTQANLENQVLTSGEVKTKEEFVLYANAVGTLREFSVKEGDTVKKGQVIGKIDASDVESRILELEAQMELERANLAKLQAGAEPEEIAQQQERVLQQERNVQAAEKEYQRMNQLYQSGAATAQELEKTKAILDAALSELKLAKQDLALKQKGPRQEELQSIQAQLHRYQAEKAQLEKERVHSVLIAPSDGTVLTRAAKNGQYVNKGTELLTIGNLDQLIVEAEVNESDVRKIELGQSANIEGSSLGKEKLQAKVARIAPIAVTTQSGSGQGEKTRVLVTLELMEHSAALKPGFHVDVNIVVQKIANALQVPIEAVMQEQDGSTYVWVNDKGFAKKRKVEVGIENELSSEIKSGLKADEEIIVNPPEFLKENDMVSKQAAGMMPGM
jgi:HlyD family secretion protein